MPTLKQEKCNECDTMIPGYGAAHLARVMEAHKKAAHSKSHKEEQKAKKAEKKEEPKPKKKTRKKKASRKKKE